MTTVAQTAPSGGPPEADRWCSTGPERSRDAPRASWQREVPLMALTLAGVAALVYRVWERDWSVPVAGGDLLAHAAVLETTGWTGTPAPSSSLGAPHGVSWADMPSGADRSHLIMLRGLRGLTGDSIVALNLYMVLAVVLVGVAAFVVVRRLGASALASGVAAVVFAVAPAHFARMGVGHAYLVAYFAVPIGVWLALWASGATLPSASSGTGPSWRRGLVPAVLVVLVGSSSAYYAVFAALTVAAVGAVVALRRSSWSAVVRPGVVSGGILAVVVANVAGEAATRSGGGEAGVRLVLDSDSYGLRVAQMALPVPDHRVGVLADWADGAYRVLAPGDRGAPLGLVALVGVLALVVWCVRNLGTARQTVGLLEMDRPGRSGVLARLGVIAAAVVATAAVGGLGMILATLGFTQIRAWSRMAVLVGFVGVAVAAMLFDGVVRSGRLSSAMRLVGAVTIVAVALFDQVSLSAVPDAHQHAVTWAADHQVAEGLESVLASDAQVFQLPVAAFPAEAPVGTILPNALLGPALAGSGSLRWSTGALAGRAGDWQRSLETLPTDELADALAAADFAALVVDRRGYDDDGDRIVAALRSTLGPTSGASDDGTRLWWELGARRQELLSTVGASRVAALGVAATRPVGVVVQGSPGIRSTARALDRHVGPDSEIRLTPYGDTGGPVDVRFSVGGEPGATVRVSSGEQQRTIRLGATPTRVELTVDVVPDGTTISVRTDAGPLEGVSPGWGDLRLEITDLAVLDPLLADR